MLLGEASHGTRYRFRIDDELSVPDPASRHNPQDVDGPSAVVDPFDVDWDDEDWLGRRWEDAVVYELHVGTFSSGAPSEAEAEDEARPDGAGEFGDIADRLGIHSSTPADSLSAELKHPTLGVWNVAMTIHNSSEFLSSTVPDTFTYHLKLKSSGPMSVSILSPSQFKDAILCVNSGRGNTNWCMHHSGATKGWLLVTSVNEDFDLATGCAAYLAVITAASQVTVTPDVSVTYNPAAAPTGSCA